MCSYEKSVDVAFLFYRFFNSPYILKYLLENIRKIGYDARE